ncbi:MAG: hypothetical protein JKY65_13260 [Planctomycetes bacterium]|nr:hypothetical protein [Planctomycetota bacterium]
MKTGFARLTCLGGLLVVGALSSGCPAGGSPRAGPDGKTSEPAAPQPVKTTEPAEKKTESAKATEPAKKTGPGVSPSPATPQKREMQVTENVRIATEPGASEGPRKPGASEGPLSADFPEVEIKVSASYADDAGMESFIDLTTVAGEPCERVDVLKALVACRKGWSREGGSTDQDVVETMTAYVEAWASVLKYSGRATSDEIPSSLASALYKTVPLSHGPKPRPELRDGLPDYHPPRVALYKLDNGEQIVVSSAFYESDGGNHGTQWNYRVEAFRVSDGSPFELAPAPGRTASLGRTPAAPSGPQPIDPKLPRSCHFSEDGF